MKFVIKAERFHEALPDVETEMFGERHPSALSADCYGEILVAMLLRLLGGNLTADLTENPNGTFTMALKLRIGTTRCDLPSNITADAARRAVADPLASIEGPERARRWQMAHVVGQ